MEQQPQKYNQKNVLTLLKNDGVNQFNIPEEGVKIFNEVAPALAKYAIDFKKVKSATHMKLFSESLSYFNITLNQFYEFLSTNPNLDFPLTKFEELKSDAFYLSLSVIQNSTELSEVEKLSRIQTLWKQANVADYEKRSKDTVITCIKVGVTTISTIAVASALGLNISKVIQSIKIDPTKIAVEAQKTARTEKRWKSLLKLLKRK